MCIWGDSFKMVSEVIPAIDSPQIFSLTIYCAEKIQINRFAMPQLQSERSAPTNLYFVKHRQPLQLFQEFQG